MPAAIDITELDDPGADPAVGALLVDLTYSEQDHYNHPRETREELAARLRPQARFSGENRVFVARDAHGEAVGLCWVVLFDPGTGLEAEVAELYVPAERRNQGIATALLRQAVRLMQRRHVTFASVWTRHDNAPALAAYRAAGFGPTEQAVLTWLPIPPDGDGQPG